MTTEPPAVLAVDIAAEHFPDGDEACITAGLFLARKLSEFLRQHGHVIRPGVERGLADDGWVVLDSKFGDVEHRFVIVFFPEPGHDNRMAIQYGIHVGIWRRLLQSLGMRKRQSPGTLQLSAGDPLHGLLQEFGRQFSAAEMLTAGDFAKRY